MGNFKQIGGKRFSKKHEGGFAKHDGGRPFSTANSWGANRDSRPVTMHQATCAQCGKSCEVPFRPTGYKPLYCRDCFQHKRTDGGRNENHFPQRNFRRNDFSKSVFKDHAANDSSGELISQLRILNAKIDRLIAAMETIAEKNNQN